MSAVLGAFVTLGLQALLPITLGSFKSLRTPKAVRARKRKARLADRTRLLGDDDDDDDDDDDVEDELDETLTLADSLLFPVLGSAALLGFWALLKYVDKKWINLVLGVYFSGASVFAVFSTFSSLFALVLRAAGVKGKTYHVRISSGIKQIFHLPLRRASLLALPLALALPALYVPLDRPYVLSNILALCLATAALALLRLDGFPTAVLLLALLLVYDIFWVFYTPVMVTVAKGIDAPIKLLAPKSGTGDFAMLGLGDVVIPGLMIALCLRFDFARHVRLNPRADTTPRTPFSRPYFYTSVMCYVAGLTATIVAMQVQHRAQPALLYLSPACVAGPLLLALVRGELGLWWSWRDDDDKDEKDERDDTIEAPSEVAQMARREAKEKEAQREKKPLALNGATDVPEQVPEPEPVVPHVDESWMDSPAPAPAAEKQPRKRRGKKK